MSVFRVCGSTGREWIKINVMAFVEKCHYIYFFLVHNFFIRDSLYRNLIDMSK